MDRAVSKLQLLHLTARKTAAATFDRRFYAASQDMKTRSAARIRLMYLQAAHWFEWFACRAAVGQWFSGVNGSVGHGSTDQWIKCTNKGGPPTHRRRGKTGEFWPRQHDILTSIGRARADDRRHHGSGLWARRIDRTMPINALRKFVRWCPVPFRRALSTPNIRTKF